MLSDWSSPGWIPIGLLLSVLGIGVGIAGSWWFARGPRLLTTTAGMTLVAAPKHDQVTVRYNDEVVQRVTISAVWVWHRGRSVLRGQDIVTSDPLFLRLPDGCQILEIAVSRQSARTNNVRVAATDEPNKAKIDFDYLDSGQGFVVDVYHTAVNPESPTVVGTIMGLPRGVTRVRSGSHLHAGWDASLVIASQQIPVHLRAREDRPAARLKRGLKNVAKAIGG